MQTVLGRKSKDTAYTCVWPRLHHWSLCMVPTPAEGVSTVICRGNKSPVGLVGISLVLNPEYHRETHCRLNQRGTSFNLQQRRGFSHNNDIVTMDSLFICTIEAQESQCERRINKPGGIEGRSIQRR